MTTNTATKTAPAERSVIYRSRGRIGSEGAGVRIRRYIGTPEIELLDPFLMLDWFHSDEPSDYLAGFPDHPHKGFETVTYMLAGKMRHWDNKGHSGVIEPGGIQWMTASGGLVHSEMPEQENGLMSGFQLWINLPAKDKNNPPAYQEFPVDRIAVDQRADAKIHVVTGTTSAGVTGPVRDVATDPVYFDIHLGAGASVTEPVPAGHNAFVIVHEGAVRLTDRSEAGSTVLNAGELAVLGPGESVTVAADGGPAKALLVAGRPIKEPVARGGPFVMNTREELIEAYRDFQAGRF